MQSVIDPEPDHSLLYEEGDNDKRVKHPEQHLLKHHVL